MIAAQRRIFSCLALSALLAMLSACDRDTPPAEDNGAAVATVAEQTSEASDEAAMHKIAWDTGDVDAAFARAAVENKPLFLYWGAAWCPPCNQIKATIFNQPEFIEKSRLFVPVYLDGDTARAQKIGERFGVMGYPTMIVFNSAGEELTRIPGGLDIGLYADVLDLTLQDVRPVSDVVEALMADQPLSDDDFRLLAYYSWGQDNERVLAERNKVAVFKRMFEACPTELRAESARLYAEYLSAAIAEAEENETSLSEAQKVVAVERAAEVLTDPDLSRANVYMVLYGAGDIVAATTEPDSLERKGLLREWNKRLDAISGDAGYSTAHRLATMLTRISFARLDDPEAPIPAALQEQAMQRVAWADEQARTPYQRQAVINTAWYVLWQAELNDEARALLTAELAKSRQPYYFMSDLAELEKEAGNTDQALAWLRRAYQESEGPATRFQWGYGYIDGLIEMTPEDADTIAAETDQVLSELDGHADAIHGRTGRIMKRLGEKLASWNEDGRYDQQVAAIQNRVASLCAGISDVTGGAAVDGDDSSVMTCQAFLEES